MGRMAEMQLEQPRTDLLDAEWAHEQELELRRQREDAALTRARERSKELRDIIHSFTHRKPA